MFRDSDLLRVVEGECSAAEAAAIRAWVAADPARIRLLEDLTAVWRLTGDPARSWDTPGALAKVLAARGGRGGRRTMPRLSGFPSVRAAHGMPRRLGWLARVAAGLALVIAGAAAARLGARAVPVRTYSTGPGQRLEVTFSDGSRVLLGVASQLQVPRDFGVHRRVVTLDGEAYFDIRHDPERPFIVRTRHGSMEDLGTAFDVRTYRDEDSLQVVVATGRVALRAPDDGSSPVLTLASRERGVIDARGKMIATTGVALQPYLAWTHGSLVFDDAPLSSVTAQLDRWYDLDIQADPALETARVTISFATPSPDEAVSALAGVLNVRFARAGRSVRLISAHPPH